MTIDTTVKQDLKQDLKKPLAGLGGGDVILGGTLTLEQSEVISLTDSNDRAVLMSPDGTKLLIGDLDSGDNWGYRQFDLSTPRDLTTISGGATVYYSNTLRTRAAAWSSDGLRLDFAWSSTLANNHGIGYHTVTSPFDISTISATTFDNWSTPYDYFPQAVRVREDPDGLKALVKTDKLFVQYIAGIPLTVDSDINSEGNVTLDRYDYRLDGTNSPGAVWISPDGELVIGTNIGAGWFQKWPLATPWSGASASVGDLITVAADTGMAAPVKGFDLDLVNKVMYTATHNGTTSLINKVSWTG